MFFLAYKVFSPFQGYLKAVSYLRYSYDAQTYNLFYSGNAVIQPQRSVFNTSLLLT